MASVVERVESPTVRATVQFSVNTGKAPVALVKQPGEGEDERIGTFEQREIEIHDGRAVAVALDLDRHGFRLTDYPTAVKDFYDDEEVRAVYYPEMERLVRAETGAAKVVVFDHTIRVGDRGKQEAHKVRAPVRNMHNDFTVRSAEQRVRDLLPAAEAEARLAKRFGSINVWRPIAGPVLTAPLAICEYGSIADGDLIAAERRYQDRIGGVYHLSYNAEQRWYYFPRMETGEVVLLKCFDSLTDGTARWTAHGSFDHPDTPADAPPRESIEIRTMMFWD
ncbi:MAG: methyltransferase [Alphaproteobacteria bacterium]|nr:methyltransferase [Alphaproteobacteria bacterium]